MIASILIQFIIKIGLLSVNYKPFMKISVCLPLNTTIMEESTRKRFCKICKTPIKGRSDKVFCDATCKAYYHNKLKEVTNEATANTDNILHRNRSILLKSWVKIDLRLRYRKVYWKRKISSLITLLVYMKTHKINAIISYMILLGWILKPEKY